VAAYFSAEECKLADFTKIIDDGYAASTLDNLPHATSMVQGVVVYDCNQLELPSQGRSALEAEIADVLMNGCGIVVFQNAMEHAPVDAVSAAFQNIIDNAAGGGGDHFAKAGANDRIWNALEKLAVTHPKVSRALSPPVLLPALLWRPLDTKRFTDDRNLLITIRIM